VSERYLHRRHADKRQEGSKYTCCTSYIKVYMT